MEFYTLHLFAGAGGGILADELLGFRTIGAVEIESYPREVLLSRQLTGQLPRFPVWDDIRTFGLANPDTREYIKLLRGINDRLCIAGGFPCQDISAAGKGEGITGEKSGLWKEFARLISEIRPNFVFLENSPLLVKRGLDVVITDLAERGYSLAWRIVSAQDVGAPHQRKRFWGLAIPNGVRDRQGRFRSGEKVEANRQGNLPNANSECCEEFYLGGPTETTLSRLNELRLLVSNSLHNRNVERIGELSEGSETGLSDGCREEFNEVGERREIEPRVGGMVNGLSDWVDRSLTDNWFVKSEFGLSRISDNPYNRTKRLKALGNAQVPLCAAVAFELLLKDICEYVALSEG